MNKKREMLSFIPHPSALIPCRGSAVRLHSNQSSLDLCLNPKACACLVLKATRVHARIVFCFMATPGKTSRPVNAPDLSEFRKRYPLTVAKFGALANREAWLYRIWESDTAWQEAMEKDNGAQEVIVRGAPPARLSVEGEFEVIYAGGSVGLLHAAVMASR